MGLRPGRLDHRHAGRRALRIQPQRLGPDAVEHLPARRDLDPGGEWPAAAAGDAHPRRLAAPADGALQQVHRRRADEGGDEGVRRAVVEVERRADLLDVAVAHDHDAIGHRHRLDLVVGDIDGRGPEPLVQGADLGPHRHPELGVEVRQRLVEQEHLGVAHDGPAHGDPLALPARQLARQPLQKRCSSRIAAARPTS